MFNLYSITRNQEAIRRLFQVTRDLTDNLPALPAVYLEAPVIRAMANASWGIPAAAESRQRAKPAEGHPLVCARRMPAAFCLCGDLAAWTGEGEDETGEHQLLAFLTTESNHIVRPDAKAMPVLLTTAEEWDTWLTGSVEQAIALQMPLANEMMCIVATGEKSEQAPVDELRCRCLHRLSPISNRRRTLLEEGDASEKRQQRPRGLDRQGAHRARAPEFFLPTGGKLC
jgi:hypothetical protein